MTEILQNMLAPFPSQPVAYVFSITPFSRYGVEKHPLNRVWGRHSVPSPRGPLASALRHGRPVRGDTVITCFIVGAPSTDRTSAITALNVMGIFVTDVKSWKQMLCGRAAGCWFVLSPDSVGRFVPSLPPAPLPVASPSWVSDARKRIAHPAPPHHVGTMLTHVPHPHRKAGSRTADAERDHVLVTRDCVGTGPLVSSVRGS